MVQPNLGFRQAVRPVLETYTSVTAATYTAKAGDRVLGVNRAGTVTITLPTAEVRAGRIFTVKDESGAAATNSITIATEGSETIDGSATDTISNNYGSKIYYSDGSNWFTVLLLDAGSHALNSHTGTLQHEKGGLEADVNAGDGFVEIKGGSTTVMKSNLAASDAPGANDDSGSGYAVGSVWIDTTNDKAYVCLDATSTAAVWTQVTGAATAADISARVYHSAAQSTTSGSWFTPTFNSENFDTDTIHDNSTNNSRLTCKTAGKYLVYLNMTFISNTTGTRLTGLLLNGSEAQGLGRTTHNPSAGSDTHMIHVALVDLAVNDYLEAQVWQDSGGSLQINQDGGGVPGIFGMVKVLG